MHSHHIITLRDCTQYREILETQPPPVAHLGVLLCVVTVVAGLVWAALAPVDLVVRAPGRVRPLDIPTQVFSTMSEHVEGRVAEVLVEEGNAVRQGDILLRLDTRRLDHEIATVRRRLEGAQAELDKLGQLTGLQQRQYEIAQTKATAELDQATAELSLARQAQELAIRQARIKLATALDQQARWEKLLASRAMSEQQVVEAKARRQAAEEDLNLARVPLDETRLTVLRQAVALVDRDYAVRAAELETRLIAKRQEMDTATKELADLERQLALTVLRSPIDGVVTRGQFHVGDVVPLGSPVFEIAPQAGFCFESTIASQDMGLVRDGMPGRVKLDAYDYQLYGSLSGTVCFISPDTGNHGRSDAAAQETTYRVRVSLPSKHVGQGEFRGAVKLGMAGQVEIITDRRTVLSLLIHRIRSSISFG